MPLVAAKCPECGGLVEVDSEKRAGLCQHCRQPFVVEDAIQTFNTYFQTTNNYNTTHNYGDGAVVNVYEDPNKDFVIEAGVLKEYHGESVDVVVPNNVFEISETAFSSKPIRSIVIPESVETIGYNAFEGCSRLEKIDISDNFKNFSRILDSSFTGSFSIKNNSESFVYENGVLYDKAKTKIIHADKWIEEAIIPSTVISISNRAFSMCKMLTKIKINDGLKSIGDYAFYLCSNILQVVLPNSVEKIGVNAFVGCNRLERVVLSDDMTIVPSNCFSFCSSLISVNLRNITKISNGAFYHCSKLENIIIPKSTKVIECEAFKYCEKLSDVTINSLDIEFGIDALPEPLKEKAIKQFKIKREYEAIDNKANSTHKRVKKEYVATASTIEEAVENAKMRLNINSNEKVEIEVLRMPRKKTLGLFGGQDAMVKVSVYR